MATVKLSEGNSAYVEITLTNPLDATSIDDATVTGELFDEAGAVSIIASFAIPYIPLSSGVYRAVMPPDVLITNGNTYNLQINSTTPSSLVGYWSCFIKAGKADGCC